VLFQVVESTGIPLSFTAEAAVQAAARAIERRNGNTKQFGWLQAPATKSLQLDTTFPYEPHPFSFLILPGTTIKT
jgi:hypothetical protein